MGRTALVTAAAAVLAACPSNTQRASVRAVSVGSAASGIGDGGIVLSAAGAAPAPQTCPPAAPVLCDGGCCAAGQTCAGDGGCAEAVAAGGCPADAPVACSGPLTCAGGVCTAFDSSGNGRNFAVAAPSGFVAGRYGGGISLQGATACPLELVTTDAGGLPAGTDPLTLELWMRNDGGATGQVIFKQGPNRVLSESGGGLYWADNGHTFAFSAGPWNDGAWHFIAATSSASVHNLYVDGVLRATGATGAVSASDAGVVLLGTCNAFVSPNSAFSGDLDELRILDYVADGGQVAADFDGGRLAAGPGVAGLWHFDEGEPSRCCPAGTACDDALGCSAATGPQTNTVDCGDGGFCPPGLVCAPSGCAHPGGGLTCPPGAPVDCGNETCCPTGEFCASDGTCRLADAGVPNANPCASFAPTAFALAGSQMACCQTFSYPMTAFSSAGVTCTGGGSLTGAICEFGGLAVGCGNGGCNAGPDVCCEDPSGQFQTCMENAVSTFTCGAGLSPCSGDSTHPGGCCPSGTVCGGTATCCPSGETACGSGCCTPGQCVAGSCVAPPAPQTCPSACPEGSACSGGYCVVSQPAPTVCGNGTPCGAECCPNGESCVSGSCVHGTVAITCPDNLPSQCGPAGPCCRADFTCFGNAGPGPSGFYCVGLFPAQHGGPAGAACAGAFCDTGLACADAALCCPAGLPQACGSACCAAEDSCVAGQCGCPSGETVCGSACCAAGSACVAGACVPTCDGQPACGGDFCCAAGVACADGKCACPGDHPVQCGDACCLPGAACDGPDGCGCPPGRASCSDVCCAAGDVCTSSGCAPPEQSGGGCGSGLAVSLQFCAGSALSGSCSCNSGSTNTCAPPSYFTGLGVPQPAACTPEHGSCFDGRIMDRPCCPGLSCAVGAQCGGAGGGECVKL